MDCIKELLGLGVGADEFGSGHQCSAFETNGSVHWQDEALPYLTLATRGLCRSGTKHKRGLCREVEEFSDFFPLALS